VALHAAPLSSGTTAGQPFHPAGAPYNNTSGRDCVKSLRLCPHGTNSGAAHDSGAVWYNRRSSLPPPLCKVTRIYSYSRGTSLIRKRLPLASYSRPIPMHRCRLVQPQFHPALRILVYLVIYDSG